MANLGAIIWSKDKGASGVEADKSGLKTLYRTVDRLILITQKVLYYLIITKSGKFFVIVLGGEMDRLSGIDHSF
ncbi:MAG: hypothetical protein ACE5R6_17795 [Candidatus Heimdallarchaeota archaeon]